MRKILATVRKAVEDYEMIEEGDRIAVGLSGGKDSLVLLEALKQLSRFYPKKFSVIAITIDMGFEGVDFEPLKRHVAALDVPYTIVPTELYKIIFVDRKEKSPCSLCSKMRRGALNTALLDAGCNKLALGHHMDDVIETFFLSLLHEGRLNTFKPVSFMDRTGVTMIRPLIYTPEKSIVSYAKNLPVVYNPCPSNHSTQREYMKSLIADIQKDIPDAKKRIFGALSNPERNSLW